MEFDAAVRRAFCCGKTEEKKTLLPLDCSIVLPDYFPDVMKILRYTARAVKAPVAYGENEETVSGTVNVEVSYVSEEGELCSCSQLQGFSHVFETAGKVAAAETDIRMGELGCKAVSKRRIDLHGSIEVTLRVLCYEEKEYVSSISGGGAVLKTGEAETKIITGEYAKEFTIEETGELGYGKPPFGKVLRSSAFAEVTECHVIQDKIVTKGEVRVSVLWQPEIGEENDEEGPFVSNFCFPVSRMTDAEGIEMTDICDAKFEAGFPEIRAEDGGKTIGIKIRVGVFARSYKSANLVFVKDAFSSDYEMRTATEKLCFIDEAMPVNISENIFEETDIPEEAEKVTDIWIETSEPRYNGEGKISAGMKICMFALDGDNNPLYFEKEAERNFALPTHGENAAFYNLCCGVRSCEFSVGRGKKAEISAAVLIDGTIYTALSTECITACSIDENKKVEHREEALTLCFAEKGEEIWDIAKKYRVPMNDILLENGISEEVLLEKTMLVIPG